MIENLEKSAEQAAAFQKMWTDSISKMMQTVWTHPNNSPPPEIVRQLRSSIFQALGESWDEFMRSPQFVDSMRQWMESAIGFRKITNEFMARARNEMQSPSRDDIDTVMLAVRHMEKRLLDRINELSAQVDKLSSAVVERKRQAPGAQRHKPHRRSSSNPAGTSKTPERKAL